jgi:hypothetical protein
MFNSKQAFAVKVDFFTVVTFHNMEQASSFGTSAVRPSPFLMDLSPPLLGVYGFLLKSLVASLSD